MNQRQFSEGVCSILPCLVIIFFLHCHIHHHFIAGGIVSAIIPRIRIPHNLESAPSRLIAVFTHFLRAVKDFQDIGSKRIFPGETLQDVVKDINHFPIIFLLPSLFRPHFRHSRRKPSVIGKLPCIFLNQLLVFIKFLFPPQFKGFFYDLRWN